MIVSVDLATDGHTGAPSVCLDEPADCGRFHIVACGPGGRVALATALVGIGGWVDEDGDHAYVPAAALRTLAAGRVGERWDAEFSRMLEYASTKGWLDGAREAIRGHVEWE